MEHLVQVFLNKDFTNNKILGSSAPKVSELKDMEEIASFVEKEIFGSGQWQI